MNGTEMKKLDCVIGEMDYGFVCIPKSCLHRTVGQTIIGGKVFEQDTINRILEYRGDGIVVHAGAFIGDMLPAISGVDKRVYAFEPGRDFFRCAQITMALNFDDSDHNTILINKGLANTVKFDAPLLSRESEELSEGGGSRILRITDGVEPYRIEAVELTTIDGAVPMGEISLIHLDVEGFEEDALRGGVMNLRASKPVLILEIGRDEDNYRLETEFFQGIIFGELGYRQVGESFHGNRLYIA